MKKVFLLIIVFLLSIVNVSAQAKFEMGSKTVFLGESISVEIYIKDNPGFGVLSMKVKFDSTLLEYVSYESTFDGSTFMGVETDRDGAICFYALNTQKSLMTENNVPVLKLNFKDKGKIGKSDIILEIQNYAYDEALNLEYQVENGAIIIEDLQYIQEDKDISLKEELPKELPKEDVKWVTSDSSVATVDEEGNVTFSKNGQVTITAIQNGKEVYEKNYDVNLKEKEPLPKEEKVERKENPKGKNYVFILFSSFILFLLLLKVVVGRKKRRLQKK